MDCIINPLTGRAVKIDSPAGRRALKYNSKNNLNASHDCLTNPLTGRAIKKDSPLGRKILKGLISEVKPKMAKKEPPAPIVIPKKKYDFGDFKTPTKYPDSPPLARTRSVPKNMGKTKKETKPKAEPKAEPKAYTMYKKPIGPIKPPNNSLETLKIIGTFIKDTEEYLKSKSKRAFNDLMKKYDNKEYISEVIGAQIFGDFYPTPQKCLNHAYGDMFKYFADDEVILEPTAGLGSIVYWLLNNKVKNKIITTDFDANLHIYLKNNFEKFNNVDVIPHEKSDYLKLENNFVGYKPTVIFLNPPFSKGNDKRYYLNFLYKALYDLKNSKSRYNERQLFFISPPLTKNEKDGRQINLGDDIEMSPNKKKEIMKMLNIDEEEFYNISPMQMMRIKTCKEFAGTNIEAVFYHAIIYVNDAYKNE